MRVPTGFRGLRVLIGIINVLCILITHRFGPAKAAW
jgi:hypothetical protein